MAQPDLYPEENPCSTIVKTIFIVRLVLLTLKYFSFANLTSFYHGFLHQSLFQPDHFCKFIIMCGTVTERCDI